MELADLLRLLPAAGPSAPAFQNPESPYLQDVASYADRKTHRIVLQSRSAGIEDADAETEAAPRSGPRSAPARPAPAPDRYREAWSAFLGFIAPEHPLYSKATLSDIESEMRQMLVAFVSEDAIQARLGGRTARNALAALSGARTPAALGALEELLAYLKK